MFVAVCDQLFVTSTSSWRKIVAPFSFPISAVRFSHSTASNGDTFPSVKNRSNIRPLPAPAGVFSVLVSVTGDFPLNACLTVAIPFLRATGLPLARGTLSFYSSASGRGAALHHNATAIRFLGSVKALGGEGDSFAVPLKKRLQNANALPLAGGSALSLTAVSRASLPGAEQIPRSRFLLSSPTGFADAMRSTH